MIQPSDMRSENILKEHEKNKEKYSYKLILQEVSFNEVSKITMECIKIRERICHIILDS